MTAPDSLFLELQAALAGRYSLLRELGRGGMGIVYLAREVRLDRLVALKLLPPTLAENAELRARFLREARIAAKLSQPNIVPIFAADEAGPFVYYAMAYVEGDTLGDTLAKRGTLPAAQAVRILRDVAYALGYAHGQGVIHRDIKPENILLEEATGRVMVADFGIAQLAGAHTSGGHVAGTPAYMSPEQAGGTGPIDGRADLYSLGVLAWAMLAGRLPFEGPGAPARKLTQPAPALASVVPLVQPALARLVDRCLATRPEDRFPRAEDVVAALDALAAVQQRRIPAPLERWVATGENLRPGDAFLTAVGTVPLFAALDLVIDGLFSGTGHYAENVAIVIGMAAPMLLWSAARLLELRRIRRDGFSARDLAAAVRERARLESAEEDAATTGTAERLSTIARGAVGAGLIAGGLYIARALTAGDDSLLSAVFGGYTTIAGIVAAWRVFTAGRGRWQARVLEWRARFWQGGIGSGLARLVGRGTRSPVALQHQPTEMALGDAARAMLAALPATARERLAGIEGVLERLESRARAAREAGNDAELRDAVALLETMRLDLLRLSSGGVTQGITADFEAAGDVGKQVDALLEGRQAAERLLGGVTPA